MSMFRRRLLMYQALMNKNDVISYPGLIAAWSAKGKTNDDADRAILKDLTGNGHDIILNGFAFSEMSGYGGYNVGEDNEWGAYVNWQKKYDLYEFSHNKLHIKGCKSSWEILKITQASNCVWESFKIKLTRNKPSIKIQYRYIDETGTIRENNYLKDGINIIPKSYNLKEGSNNPNLGIFGFTTFYTDPDFECTIELLPEYPDALVFDGVDDYGFCTNIPLLEDYTIIVKRKDCSGGCLFTKGVNTNGAFILEEYGFTSNTYNYGQGQNKNLLLNNTITWQNKNSYNQQNLIVGDKSDNTNRITIGALNGIDSRYLKGAFYSAYLFDRSLDEQEIKSFIRKYIDPEYLLPSKIPTPDCYYDFSKGSNDDETRDIIKDYSGNGNDAVAHGFAWNEDGSGYKDGALYFDGVDDCVSLDAFDSGFKTMFMVCNPRNKSNAFLYDQRKNSKPPYDYALYTYNSVAYNMRNANGTYINGIKNTKVFTKDLNNKKILISVNSELTQLNKPTVGAGITGSYSDMALYKFLGFKEALTEEQIQTVIKKYNLLDLVDEIEVS